MTATCETLVNERIDWRIASDPCDSHDLLGWSSSWIRLALLRPTMPPRVVASPTMRSARSTMSTGSPTTSPPPKSRPGCSACSGQFDCALRKPHRRSRDQNR